MSQRRNINVQDENDFKKVVGLFFRNFKLFTISLIIAIALAFFINHYSIPVYKISSSILIKENKAQQSSGDVNNFLNSSLFGNNQNFQNELWVLKSSPVMEQTVRDLDLLVNYYEKSDFKYQDAYQNIPFRVIFIKDHPQPINVKFELTFLIDGYFNLKAKSKEAVFYNFETGQAAKIKDRWSFNKNGIFGELIETDDLAFIIEADSSIHTLKESIQTYAFEFKTVTQLKNELKNMLEFNVVDKMATVIEISIKMESVKKGEDIVNELMDVYSSQNLERKNHIASITIDYIEKQLDEISDSLSQTEDHLQSFRSSNQLLNVKEQANDISQLYMNLQNQLAELVTRKQYYDYVADYLEKNSNFSNMIIPSSLGIQDPLLNNLMSELISAQAQRSNLIENNQERNPLVQKLGIQIDNVKETIFENITEVIKTTNMAIEEMNKRISKTKAEISRLPQTQRELGSIERKYSLNNAIYNYLLEKRAEAKITKASNLPDNLIIEPAAMVGMTPISPNKRINYIIALIFGMALPFGFLTLKSALNNKIEGQDDIEQLTSEPILGKILHNRYKTENVMFEFPKSDIAESFRALRTNLDFYVRGGA